MDEILKPIANFFGVDISTMWKSIFSGTSSTGVGWYVANIHNFNWQFDVNFVSIVWAAISCVVLTVLSLMVSDLYKMIKKKIINRKK